MCVSFSSAPTTCSTPSTPSYSAPTSTPPSSPVVAPEVNGTIAEGHSIFTWA